MDAQGIASGIAGGLAGYNKGVDVALDRQAKQQQLTQQSQEFEMRKKQFQQQQSQGKTAQQLQEEQLKQTQMQVQKMQDQLSQQRVFQAFDGGTLTDLNSVLDKDQNLQSHPLIAGVQKVEKVDMSNPEFANVADKITANGGEPVLLSKIVNGKIVQQVGDLSMLKHALGYSTFKVKRDAEIDASKATTELKEAQAEYYRSGSKSMQVQPGTLEKDMVYWMKTHPNATEEELTAQVDRLFTAKDSGVGQNRETIDIVQSSKASDIGKSLLVGDTTITPKQRQQSEKQFINTPEYKDRYKTKVVDFDTQYDGFQITKNIADRLNTAISDGKYSTGVYDTAVMSLAKYTPEQFQKLLGKSNEEIATQLGIDSSLGRMFAADLKATTGTAASDAEVARTVLYSMGNSMYDEKTKQIIFNNNVEDKRKALIESGKDLVNAGMVDSVYDKYKELTKGSSTSKPGAKASDFDN